MSSIKITDASQAHNITYYKNLKRKILKCCANIYFNKQCLQHNLVLWLKLIYIYLQLQMVCCSNVLNNKNLFIATSRPRSG